MSRRKVKGLTRTGRQVSEDPDLDNLLSTLSPEEMEELEKDMMKVPDLNPEDGKVIVQGESQPAQAPVCNNVEDGKLRSDPKGRLSQREQSLEVCGFCFDLTEISVYIYMYVCVLVCDLILKKRILEGFKMHSHTNFPTDR